MSTAAWSERSDARLRMAHLKRALPAFRLGLVNASPLLVLWVMALATTGAW